MKRAKPSTASPQFSAVPHTLSNRAREKMLEALGVDPYANDADAGTAAIALAERCLGAYPAIVANVERAPRAAEYRDVLRPLGRRALVLANDVANLYGYLHQALNSELAATGRDIDSIALTLSELHAAAYRAAERAAKAPMVANQGKPARFALEYVVGELCRSYRGYARISPEPRELFGSQSNLSEWEQGRRDFVAAALTDAGIAYPQNLQAVILRVTHRRNPKT